MVIVADWEIFRGTELEFLYCSIWDNRYAVQRISKNVGYSFLITHRHILKKTFYDFIDMQKKINHYFSLVVFSLFVGMFVVAKEVVLGFYGGEWVGMCIHCRFFASPDP